MLKKRIIPCLDVRDGRVVKGKQFANIQDVDCPITLGARYASQGADELVFYDITASAEARKPFYDVIDQVARTINIPFMVGGGIRSLDDMGAALQAGADKVSINSAAVADPGLIAQGAQKYGAQCIVVSLDVLQTQNNQWQITTHGGSTLTGLDAIQWAKQAVDLGAGELVINSMKDDGMKRGFDLDLMAKISASVSVPVIASGGAGQCEDFYKVLQGHIADGALAASVFHYGTLTIPELKDYLKSKKVPIR